MFKRIQAVIGVLCILVYISSAVYAGYKIYTGIKDRKTTAEKDFSELKDFAARAGVLGFLNKDFRDDIKNYMDSCPALDAVIIYGIDGRTFAVEKRANLVAYTGDIPRFNPNLRFYRAPFSEGLNITGINDASISAISALVDFNYLLSTLRTSLLAILIAFVVSFSSLILDVAGITANKKESVHGDDNNVDSDDVDDDSNNESGIDIFDIDIGGKETEQEAPCIEMETPVIEHEVPIDEEFFDGFPDFVEPPAEDDKPVENIENTEVEEPVEPTLIDLDIDPFELPEQIEQPPEQPETHGGLLQAASKIRSNEQINDEKKFADILDEELNQAEHENKDLVLMGVEWNDPAVSNQQLIIKGVKYLKNRTMVFEKGTGGKGLNFIIQETDIDEGFRLAQEFHRQSLEDFSGNFEDGLLIGLSCRGERHINASRLIKETERALQEAREDSVRPIVGFKVDAEKYKKFEASRDIQ
ncbi:hypothetical protein FACS1894190_03070 [Spirochaetia bacterium]|nr:hypothetical protein FACS1894190_03070 [Spirochaetia bacterium]